MSTFNFSPKFLISLCFFYLISMCSAITFEQYEARQGVQFCGVYDAATLKNMCTSFARLHNITGYNEAFLIAECQSYGILLFKENGNPAPVRRESLLRCNYDFPPQWNDQYGAFTNTPGYYPAFGKGIGQNDIMRFQFSSNQSVKINGRNVETYVPAQNIENFFR